MQIKWIRGWEFLVTSKQQVSQIQSLKSFPPKSNFLVVCPRIKTAVRSFIFVLKFVTSRSQYIAISHWWFYKRKKHFWRDFGTAVYDKTLKGNWELTKIFLVFENSCIICLSASPVQQEHESYFFQYLLKIL